VLHLRQQLEVEEGRRLVVVTEMQERAVSSLFAVPYSAAALPKKRCGGRVTPPKIDADSEPP
jgi:hypothetical protein